MPARSRPSRFPHLSLGLLVAFLSLPSACVIEADDVGTEIQFDEMTNLGYRCGEALTSWSVRARETGEEATASCQQPIRFVDLEGGRIYNFDIVGYAGKSACWVGSCAVEALRHSRRYADCSHQIQSICGL